MALATLVREDTDPATVAHLLDLQEGLPLAHRPVLVDGQSQPDAVFDDELAGRKDGPLGLIFATRPAPSKYEQEIYSPPTYDPDRQISSPTMRKRPSTRLSVVPTTIGDQLPLCVSD